MFRKEEINAYRDLKAPESLRKRIIGTQRNHNKIIGFISAAVAACIVFMISVAAIGNGQCSIAVNGEKLKDTVEFYPVASAMVKNVDSSITVPMHFDVRTDTKIWVSDGTISTDGSDAKKELIINSPADIFWRIDTLSDVFESEMIINDKKGAEKVTLEFNKGKITIIKETKK